MALLLSYDLSIWLTHHCKAEAIHGEERGNLIKQAQNKGDNVNPIFKEILAELKKKSHVPIILPRDLGNKDEPAPLYARLESISPNEYRIIIGFSPDCEGGNACRWGTVSGEKNSNASGASGVKVLLSKGITGYFILGKCGAVCSDSRIIWFNGQYKYTIGIKAAKKSVLVAVANSAINDPN